MMEKLQDLPVTDMDNPSEKKRSRKRKHSKTEDLGKSGDIVIAKKNKTSKKRGGKHEDIAQAEAHEVSDMTNKTKFPDPNEDELLQDQPRKCLAYAFSQFHCPSKWKFNKACQNWLIRNFWFDREVPEIYVPLVTAYFANVQGGARENLVIACHAALEPPKIVTPSAELPASDAPLTIKPNPPWDADNEKNSRARVVLGALILSKRSSA